MSAGVNRAPGEPRARPPILRLTQPLVRFLHVESASGLVLAVCTVVALAAANSPWADSHARLWDTNLRLGAGALELSYPLWYWINDALMVLFFFVIGLEIKRELVHGELRDARRVVLPVAAAIGGGAAPIAIFLVILPEGPGRAGWAVPMATDIAFVVGALALLGSRVPRGLKVFVLSLAIVDDIMAVVVIALFYTDTLHLAWLLGALAGLGLVVVARGAGVRAISMYFLIGGAVWLCTLKSGIHPTIAGVALGLLTPSKAGLTDAAFLERFERASFALRTQPVDEVSRRHVLSDLAFAARKAMSPLVRLESNLHPWVAFVIMPLFALANAGVPIHRSALDEPIAVAAGVGLFAANHQSLSESCACERPQPQAHRLVVDPIHPDAQLTKQREMKIGILSRNPRRYSSHRPEVLLGRSAWDRGGGGRKHRGDAAAQIAEMPETVGSEGE